MSEGTTDVKLAARSDAAEYAAHIKRHLAASGTDGEIHYAPVNEVDKRDVEIACERRWATPTDQPGWGRAWIVRHFSAHRILPGSKKQVIGHVELRGSTIHSGLHRAELSTGLETPFRGRGLGHDLVAAALTWARERSALDYVDLRTFAHNTPAQRLYARFGFREVGRVPAAFRMPDGTEIEDILMVLPLRT